MKALPSIGKTLYRENLWISHAGVTLVFRMRNA
jgi:hypothetical protein